MSAITHCHDHGRGHDQPHIGPKTYLVIYFALLGLMTLTVVAALFDLGAANFAVAMGIAVAKMLLIILYFMHVRYSERLTWVFCSAAFLWLLIFIVGTLNDYFTRGFLDSAGK
jgi:cytochrome c oxidase subunit IV